MNWRFKLSKRLSLLKGAVVIAVALSACVQDRPGAGTDPESPNGPVVAAVQVSPELDSGDVGSTIQLTATVLDSSGNTLPQQVAWHSADTTIASVNASGAVSTTAPGEVIVWAERGPSRDSAVLLVSIPVSSVAVTPASGTVGVGGTVQLSAVPRDAQGNAIAGRTIQWSSGNPSVVSVSASGLVRGMSTGSGSIAASAGGQFGVATITVSSAAPAPVASITLSPSSNALNIGNTVQLTATLRDAANNILTGRAISWSSSDASNASVSSSGVVTAVNTGSATITATSEGRSAFASVTVSPAAPAAVASVSLSPTSNALIIGGTVALTATLRDAANNVLTGRTITWSSNATANATVSSSGVVTAVAAGSATITATSEGRSGTATVSVSAPPPVSVASIALTPASISLNTGATAQLTAVLRDSANNVLTGRTITWSSTATTRATVSSSGLVTAVSAGSATITASSGGRSATASITVTAAPPVSVASITISPSSTTILIAGVMQLTATLRDSANNILTGRTVTWSTSGGAVATVSVNGLVLAVAVGNATITASSGGRTGTSAITVNAPLPPPPPPPTGGPVVFSSDWSTATGNSNSALGDGTRWNVIGGQSGMAIVSASGLGFPSGMNNVLRIEYAGGTARGITKQNGWTLPAIGGSLYRRMYFKMSIPGTVSNLQHPVQSAFTAGSCPYAAEWQHNVGTSFRFVLSTLVGGQGGANAHHWDAPSLTRNAVYRIEERFTRVTTTTWRLEARIYDANNTLIASAANFNCTMGHGSHTLASSPAPTIETPTPDCLRNFMIVHQGSYNVPGGYNYYGGFAVSMTGWVGPYVPGEGR